MIMYQRLDLPRDRRVIATDLLNTGPRKEIFHQKLGRLLMCLALPIARPDRGPIEPVQRA
jgi:hypothetical protein